MRTHSRTKVRERWTGEVKVDCSVQMRREEAGGEVREREGVEEGARAVKILMRPRSSHVARRVESQTATSRTP